MDMDATKNVPTTCWSAARQYAALGLHIVPLRHRSPTGFCSCGKGQDCPENSRAKHPIMVGWQKQASADPAVIDEWERKFPRANIGVLLGAKSGVIDVEYDTDEGRQTADRLLNGVRTPTYESGNRSIHRLFQWRDDLPGGAVIHVAGLEIRTGNDQKGAQSVLPPSVHRTGRLYEWIIPPEQAAPAPIPSALLALIANVAGEEELKGHRGTAPQIDNRELALDALARLNKSRTINYDDWLHVGMALHSVDQSLLPAWDGWSQSCSDKYQPGACAGRWASFTAGSGVGLGSLIYWARQDGWRPPWERNGHAKGARRKGKGSPAAAAEDSGLVKTLADAICALDYFAQDAGGRLYVYVNGVYRPHGERHIKGMVKTLLIMGDNTKKWSSRLASEVVEFIRTDAPELPDRPRTDLVNVENGMFRVEDRLLLPHDPKYLSAVQLPVKYDPAATCPSIEAFVRATFPPDADLLAWEIPGVLMVPATWLGKAILLLGEGCNGKSVWLSLLVRFIGKHNVATMPLHKLEIDKFAVSRLVEKLANVCADLPSEHLAGTSVFKALTGGDSLTGEYKFRDSFDLEPYARLVFSANHPPRSADSSAAFFRRWLVIPFDHTFTPDEQIPRDVLDARLQAPEELSGMLNKAIEGLRRVQRQRRFSEVESTQAAWRDFHSTTDPLAVWLDRYTIDDPDCIVTKQTLRVAYNAQVERDGRPAITAKAFGQALYKLRPNVEEAQRTVGGRLQWCYIGIGMAHGATDSQDSRDSRDSLLYFSRTREGENREDKDSSGVENIRGNPVNPVNPVGCPHANVAETPTRDGYVNRQCRDCGVNLPCRKQEQPA